MAKNSLCWDCGNCFGGCSWTKNAQFIPVEGWVADATVCDGVPSYMVYECPKYKPCPIIERDRKIAHFLEIPLKDFYEDKEMWMEVYADELKLRKQSPK